VHRRRRHAEDPPDVTVGVDELLVGVDEELPEDEDELDDEEELPPATVVLVAPDPEPDGTVAAVPVLLDPAWPWDTTTPMATVAPVAAMTAPRVRLRSRARAVSLLWGVGG
jgi:hypothetical protein